MSESSCRLSRWAALAAVAVIAAGCASAGEDTGAPCPAAKVLGEPSELVRYRDGPGRDPTDILFEARMIRVAGECAYDSDGGEIELQLDIVIEVIRGPALADNKIDFSYFVAVAERTPGDESGPAVRSREAFTVATGIPSGRRGLRYEDLLEITIPRPDGRDVRNYMLYLGFELTREELSRNREKLGY